MKVLEVCEENVDRVNDFVKHLKNNYMTIHTNYSDRENYLKVYNEDLNRISEIAAVRQIKIRHV